MYCEMKINPSRVGIPIRLIFSCGITVAAIVTDSDTDGGEVQPGTRVEIEWAGWQDRIEQYDGPLRR